MRWLSRLLPSAPDVREIACGSYILRHTRSTRTAELLTQGRWVRLTWTCTSFRKAQRYARERVGDGVVFYNPWMHELHHASGPRVRRYS